MHTQTVVQTEYSTSSAVRCTCKFTVSMNEYEFPSLEQMQKIKLRKLIFENDV